MKDLIYNPTTDKVLNTTIIGGKAHNLYLLAKEGFNVPSWFALTALAFEKSTEFRTSDNRFIMPEGLEREIYKTIDSLGLNNKYLAVRSSAVGEDGDDLSFAGQLDSFLYVDKHTVINAIKDVWLSSENDRVKDYLKNNSMKPEQLKIAVIIQEMVNADTSGVAFSIDPISGDRKSVLISSVYGLGEGLVSGLLDSDNFKITPTGIISDIKKKTQKIVLDDSKQKDTCITPVDKDLQEVPSLTQNQIRHLSHTTNEIEAFYGKPQDIEWAISNKKLYILQARPITTLDKLPDKSQHKTLWDNSNIIESYSGITSPLTYSFINVVYTEVYKHFCKIMGVEDNLIEKNSHIFDMLGLIKGRVYYNLINWYNILGLLPGYSINATFMEQMMGVKEKFDTPLTIIKSNQNEYFRITKLCLKLFYNLLTLPKEIKHFYILLNNVLTPYKNINLNDQTLQELKNHYLDIENSLIKNWHAPLVNDFFAMIFFGVLKKVITKWGIDDSSTLQNDLLIGQGDIISTQPIKNIREMSNIICQNEELKALFLNNDEETILNQIHTHKELYLKLTKHIEKFGDRCINELKLETITYKQKPQMLITLLKTYVEMDYVDQDLLNQRELNLKQTADKKVREALKGKPLKQWLFNLILSQAKSRISNRENLRYERTRVFAQIREIFIATGKQLYYENIIEKSKDIFYLTKEEIFEYISGTSTMPDLKQLIKTRKKEFKSYKKIKMPDRFETYGSPYHANAYIKAQKSSITDGDLKGIGCSPGIVKAKVKIINDPSEVKDLKGCIMVAERTDPGWAPLFPLCKGLLVERGSLLSHSAIVAREMGIPAIVSIDNLLETLKDNDIVEMDGAEGIIKIISCD